MTITNTRTNFSNGKRYYDVTYRYVPFGAGKCGCMVTTTSTIPAKSERDARKMLPAHIGRDISPRDILRVALSNYGC